MGLGVGCKHGELPAWEEGKDKWGAVGRSLSLNAGLYPQEVLMTRQASSPASGFGEGSSSYLCGQLLAELGW